MRLGPAEELPHALLEGQNLDGLRGSISWNFRNGLCFWCQGLLRLAAAALPWFIFGADTGRVLLAVKRKWLSPEPFVIALRARELSARGKELCMRANDLATVSHPRQRRERVLGRLWLPVVRVQATHLLPDVPGVALQLWGAVNTGAGVEPRLLWRGPPAVGNITEVVIMTSPPQCRQRCLPLLHLPPLQHCLDVH